MLADPHAIAASWPDARVRVLAQLAIAMTAAPWSLSRAFLVEAPAAGLTDDDVLHAIVVASFAGYLNRIADAVEVPLDYDVKHLPRAPDAGLVAWPYARETSARRHPIRLASRPATAETLAEWRAYAFFRDGLLSRRQRTLLARWVGLWLGDATISSPMDLTVNPLDDALRALAETVTLAPWTLGEAAFAPLRAVGFGDAALFDVCATAAAAGVFSRIEVALTALAA